MATVMMTVLTVLGLLGSLLGVPSSNRNAATTTSSQGGVFAVDVSANMAGAPMAGEVAAVRSLLAKLDKSTAVGLVTYGSHVQVLWQPTTRHGYIETTLDALRVEGGTALYDGTLTAIDVAGRLRTSRRM